MSANTNCHIDFLELPANTAEDLRSARSFYEEIFGWTYKTWSNNYIDTTSSGVNSGVNADTEHRTKYPLAVIYCENIEEVRSQIISSHGVITRDIFSFPGGKRFHFLDPAGNELAVWSDK